ncbi:tetraacyldisaccharide 4'-kinase, partial [Candidatus Pelagibacter sp.]|nr:tetraacyldisaccharide 4'-kinase [Candidatus Pelagibacter sp.]
MSCLSRLLLPFTLPLIINNFFLSLNKKNINKKIKTICLGNIYVGGTGKTPLTIKLNKILQELNFKTATIKKFYKAHNDEQKLLNNKSKLYCKKDRLEALDEAIKDNIDIAIFDDGLQDRSLRYDLSFVCFNNDNWIGNGQLIPSGPLRENLKSILKYDAIFLNGNEEDNLDIK